MTLSALRCGQTAMRWGRSAQQRSVHSCPASFRRARRHLALQRPSKVLVTPQARRIASWRERHPDWHQGAQSSWCLSCAPVAAQATAETPSLTAQVNMD